MSQPDRTEYLIFFAGDAEPQVKSDTREAAELWANRYKQRTGHEVRLVRRTWTKTDTPLEIREQDDLIVLRSEA